MGTFYTPRRTHALPSEICHLSQIFVAGFPVTGSLGSLESPPDIHPLPPPVPLDRAVTITFEDPRFALLGTFTNCTMSSTSACTLSRKTL